MVDPGRMVQNLPKGNFLQHNSTRGLSSSCSLHIAGCTHHVPHAVHIVLPSAYDQETSVLSCGRPCLAMSAPDVGLGFCRIVHARHPLADPIAYHAKLAFCTDGMRLSLPMHSCCSSEAFAPALAASHLVTGIGVTLADAGSQLPLGLSSCYADDDAGCACGTRKPSHHSYLVDAQHAAHALCSVGGVGTFVSPGRIVQNLPKGNLLQRNSTKGPQLLLFSAHCWLPPPCSPCGAHRATQHL